MELSAGFPDMQDEVEKIATTFLDQIGLQGSKITATSELMTCPKRKIETAFLFFVVKGLCLAFLGLLCKFFPEHMRKYADPLLLGQYLKYLHEQVRKLKNKILKTRE